MTWGLAQPEHRPSVQELHTFEKGGTYAVAQASCTPHMASESHCNINSGSPFRLPYSARLRYPLKHKFRAQRCAARATFKCNPCSHKAKALVGLHYSLNNFLAHLFLSFVLRQVELVEASVCSW